MLDGRSSPPSWGFDGQNGREYETPDSVLIMIKELNPDVLDRLYNNPISNLNAPLQYRDRSGNMVNWQEAEGAGGFPAGSIGSWLYQAIKGRVYYPRLGSELYDPQNESEFYALAQALYNNAISLGVPKEKRFLDLDNWGTILSHNNGKQTAIKILSTLYAQGWAGIGIHSYSSITATNNIPDSVAPTFASFVCAIDSVTQRVIWRPDSVALSLMKTDKHLQRYILYIDFPRMMQQFLDLSPDEEADVLTTLARLQAYDPSNPKETGYTFVFPIGQTFWDSKKRITSPTGKYKGISVYEYMRDSLLPVYNPITSVEDNRNDFPNEFRLYQNYPNPFNPTTTIRFSIPQREHVTLKVFDVLGREVATLVDKKQEAGYYEKKFNAENLPSGMYIYRLTAEKVNLVKKMMVLK
ncbi:T9SS type A sorting domain-containing protein [Melioribacteraceae bacterium 4301-Me]|uniref:T9SS type A sorting domain-containing protein n=1 Tax=Pyranulibacter aquaticus TaxID=3163344 RepID=UPI00359B0B5A